jgi:hypothetical protein
MNDYYRKPKFCECVVNHTEYETFLYDWNDGNPYCLECEEEICFFSLADSVSVSMAYQDIPNEYIEEVLESCVENEDDIVGLRLLVKTNPEMPPWGAFQCLMDICHYVSTKQENFDTAVAYWRSFDQSADGRIKIKQVTSPFSNFSKRTVYVPKKHLADLDPRIYHYMINMLELGPQPNVIVPATLNGTVAHQTYQRYPRIISGSGCYTSCGDDIDMNTSFDAWYEYQNGVHNYFSMACEYVTVTYERLLGLRMLCEMSCRMYVSDRIKIFGEPDLDHDMERQVRSIYMFAHPIFEGRLDARIAEGFPGNMSNDRSIFTDEKALALIDAGYYYQKVGDLCIAPSEFYHETVEIWARAENDASRVLNLLYMMRKGLVLSERVKREIKLEGYRIVYDGTVQSKRFGCREYRFDLIR